MNYTIIFEIKNKKNDYVVCTETIEQILSKKYNYERMSFKIVRAAHTTMPVNKFDEPLDGVDFSSSFHTVELQDFLNDHEPNLKFHIRILFSDELNLEGFHCLALMMGRLNHLIKNKKLSFFLVPRTSKIYPYEK